VSKDIDDDSRQEQLRGQLQGQGEEAAEESQLARELISAGELRRARLTRLMVVAVIVAVALAVVVVTAGGSSSPPTPGSARANTAIHEINAQLSGIPQSANTLGQPTAPITLKWFGDLECRFCKEFTLGALPSIIRRWVRAGVLKIEYLSMETATHEPKVFQAQQVAALAAGLQNKMWNFIQTFYHEQGEEDSGYVTEQYLLRLAGQVLGLNVTIWSEDRFDPELATQVAADKREAKREKFGGTPSFLIGLSNGTMYRLRPHSLTKPTRFDEAIELLLRT
jgi:protein-disulfide isomerase